MNTEQTPAQKTADILAVLVDHLRAHPHLRTVNVQRDGRAQLHIATTDQAAADALLAWADTLNVIDVRLFCYGEKRHVSVELNAGMLRPWATLDIADDFALQTGDECTITLDELRFAIAPAEDA